jgi:hypothetical protein
MKLRYALLAGIALSLAAGSSVQAGPFLGTATFNDTAAGRVSPGTDINAATSFTITNWIATGGTGTLAGLVPTTIGSITFTFGVAGSDTSFHIDDPRFGKFDSTSLKEIANAPGARVWFIVGTYVPGSVPGGPAADGSFTVSFNQSPANTGSISDSGSFAYSNAVPEPQSLVLISIGLASVSLFRKLRKRTGK